MILEGRNNIDWHKVPTDVIGLKPFHNERQVISYVMGLDVAEHLHSHKRAPDHVHQIGFKEVSMRTWFLLKV